MNILISDIINQDLGYLENNQNIILKMGVSDLGVTTYNITFSVLKMSDIDVNDEESFINTGILRYEDLQLLQPITVEYDLIEWSKSPYINEVGEYYIDLLPKNKKELYELSGTSELMEISFPSSVEIIDSAFYCHNDDMSIVIPKTIRKMSGNS
jgi:hypothetical protein